MAEAQGGQARHPLLQVVPLQSVLVRSIGLVSEDANDFKFSLSNLAQVSVLVTIEIVTSSLNLAHS